jgi:CheY-like chemotaxis protein
MRFVPIPPRRLLLIDDSAPFRQTMARLLRVAGHTVLEAETGSAGLAILRTNPADLVLTARDMPGLSGWDVARLVKATYPRVPVVLVTRSVDPIAADRRERELVDAILRPPFQFTELRALIGRLTRGTVTVPVGMVVGAQAGSEPHP